MKRKLKKLIYVASPYSHSDTSIEKMRYDMACYYTGKLMDKYYDSIFFSPIAMCHGIAAAVNLKTSWQTWKVMDEEYLKRSDEMWILPLAGWEKSNGLAAEIKFSQHLKLPIRYVNLTDLSYQFY